MAQLDRSNEVRDMSRLRIALIGAGLVGQAEHAFYLWEERDRFDFFALVEPSAAVRTALGARYSIKHLLANIDELIPLKPDAAVIAAPDPFHPSLAAELLAAGINVLCEKPLSLTLSGCEQIKTARDQSGKVLQVAYMKRHDPAFKKALELLPSKIEDVRLISVEVNDPDHEPFVSHLPMIWPADLPVSMRDAVRSLGSTQLQESAGGPMTEAEARALGGGFLSSLVHDVAVVHGLLIAMDVALPAEASHGAIFDGGRGVQLAFGLPGGGRVSMSHLNLPGVPDYTERISIYCRDRIIELTFPAPYLRHEPTRLVLKRSAGGHALECVDFRASFEEAFRDQLRSFHAAVTGAAPVATPLEQAQADIQLLISAFRRAKT